MEAKDGSYRSKLQEIMEGAYGQGYEKEGFAGGCWNKLGIRNKTVQR